MTPILTSFSCPPLPPFPLPLPPQSSSPLQLCIIIHSIPSLPQPDVCIPASHSESPEPNKLVSIKQEWLSHPRDGIGHPSILSLAEALSELPPKLPEIWPSLPEPGAPVETLLIVDFLPRKRPNIILRTFNYN